MSSLDFTGIDSALAYCQKRAQARDKLVFMLSLAVDKDGWYRGGRKGLYPDQQDHSHSHLFHEHPCYLNGFFTEACYDAMGDED